MTARTQWDGNGCRQFNDEKGFGFVIPSEGGDGEDIFCHRSEIIGAADRPILIRDQEVLFELGQGRDGRAQATAVTNIDGSPIENGEPPRYFLLLSLGCILPIVVV